MATPCPTPAPFRPAHGDPESTLRRFELWYAGMQTYLMFARRLNAQGQPVDYNEEEKLRLAVMIGGEDIVDVLTYTGNQVLQGEDAVGFTAACEATLTALRANINETAAIHHLQGMKQNGDSITQYYQRVLKAARRINWAEYTADKAARDVITRGCDSDRLRLKSLQENPTLEDLYNTALNMENAQQKAKAITKEADTVRRVVPDKTTQEHASGEKQKRCPKCTYIHRRTQTTCPADGQPCNVCKKTGHFKMSNLCAQKQKGNQQVRYLSSDEEDQPQPPQRPTHTVRWVGAATTATAETSADILANLHLQSGSEESDNSGKGESHPQKNIVRTLHGSQTDQACCTVTVNGVPITFFADTGARKSLISITDWHKIRHTTQPLKTNKTFSAYAAQPGQQIPIMARAKVTLQATRGASRVTYVYIVQDPQVESLLGREDGTALGILHISPDGATADTKAPSTQEHEETMVHRLHLSPKDTPTDQFSDNRPTATLLADVHTILAKHQHMFQGVGKAKNQVVDIPLRPEARPYIQPPRPIPFHFQPQLKKYLEEMLANDIIEGPLQGPLEAGTYVSNIVITAKRWSTEEIRVNLDLRQINKDIVMSHHPIPTPEDLRHEFRHSDTFSSLDANHMFFQWEVKEDKRKIFTFRTPWGLYRFKRLASGVNIASAECNNNLRALLTGLDGIVQIQDDIVVHGKGRQHDARLAKVLQRLDQEGFTLRRDKCVFGQPEIAWFGKVYSHAGVSIDPNKTATIRNLPTPTTKEETTSFLQMAQFNIEFLHPSQLADTPYTNYAQLTAPLRAIRQTPRFTWTADCQQAFDTIKQLMSSEKVLVHYDPQKPTRLYVDFSPCGVSATLAQRHNGEIWRPVTHVSRALTTAEKNYAQIEGESLAVLYGITRLRRYLLGTTFEVVGDHKPLLSMYNLGRQGPMRVERHKLKLQGYNFGYVWEPGNTNPADYTSRHPDTKPSQELEDDDDDLCIRTVRETLPDALSWEVIKTATRQDESLHMLEEAIRTRKPCPQHPTMAPYAKIYEELTTHDGVLIRGHRVVLPAALQQTAIQLSHAGHVGPKTTISHLRERCWFPNLGVITQTFVDTCFPCQATNPHSNQEPMGEPATPPRPWHTIHMDYKGPIANKYYVHVSIDALTRFATVDITTSTSADTLLPILDKMWATHGTCDQIITDNGPPYASSEFSRYCKRMGIQHNPTAPQHPEGNGLAENFMKKIVKVAHTATLEGKDPRREVFKMVMMHNSTAHTTTHIPPAQGLMGRKIKTLIPTVHTGAPSTQHQLLVDRTEQAKKKNKQYRDTKKRSKTTPITQGDTVLITQQKTTTKTPWNPTTYTVRSRQGRRLTLTHPEMGTKQRDINDVKVLKKPVMEAPIPQAISPHHEEHDYLDIDITAWRRTRHRTTAQNRQNCAGQQQAPGLAEPVPPGPVHQPLIPDPHPPPVLRWDQDLRDWEIQQRRRAQAHHRGVENIPQVEGAECTPQTSTENTPDTSLTEVVTPSRPLGTYPLRFYYYQHTLATGEDEEHQMLQHTPILNTHTHSSHIGRKVTTLLHKQLSKLEPDKANKEHGPFSWPMHNDFTRDVTPPFTQESRGGHSRRKGFRR